MNDFRPVALTSVTAKCFERLLSNQLTNLCSRSLRPTAVCRKGWRREGAGRFEDVTLTLFDVAANRLDTTGSSVRVLFIGFSSAFNTIQAHLLLQQLLYLNINHSTIFWVRQFLSDRPQRVSLGGVVSEELVLNTGAPQGCVLSPVVFSLWLTGL